MPNAPAPPPDPTALIVPFPPLRRPLLVPLEDSSERRPSLRALPGGAELSPRGKRQRLRAIAGGEAGQASVELVVLLPVIVVILAVAWQALLAGEALWQARASSRAAARANAIGADAAAAARAHLPAKLESGLKVKAETDGDVRVSLRIPAVLPSIKLGRVAATSHFQPQGG